MCSLVNHLVSPGLSFFTSKMWDLIYTHSFLVAFAKDIHSSLFFNKRNAFVDRHIANRSKRLSGLVSPQHYYKECRQKWCVGLLSKQIQLISDSLFAFMPFFLKQTFFFKSQSRWEDWNHTQKWWSRKAEIFQWKHCGNISSALSTQSQPLEKGL